MLADKIEKLSGWLNDGDIKLIERFILSGTVQDEGSMQLSENVKAVFINEAGTNMYENVLEAHKKNFDLHYVLNGTDSIAVKNVEDCVKIKEGYNEGHDYTLYDESPENIIQLAAGSFCLLPPGTAHMALYGECGMVKKIVFKISCNNRQL